MSRLEKKYHFIQEQKIQEKLINIFKVGRIICVLYISFCPCQKTDRTKNNTKPRGRSTIYKYITLSFNVDTNKLIGYLFKETNDTILRSESQI
jgi:hypothetical protein